MCGLVGTLGSEPRHNIPLFQHLLFIDVIRGMDSTGVAIVKRDLSLHIKKALGTPENLLFCQSFSKLVDEGEPPYVLLGHNRAATKGSITIRNAHPFVHNGVVLAHNGTLHYTTPLHEGTLPNPWGTDSEAICHHLAHNDIESTWKAIRGAAALSYWDRKDASINLITNGQRPLSYVFTKNKQNVYWASESWMLTILCGRLRIPIEEVQTLANHMHHKFRWDVQKKEVSLIKTELTPPFTPTITRPYGGEVHYTTFGTGKTNSDLNPFFRERHWDATLKQFYIWVQGSRHFLQRDREEQKEPLLLEHKPEETVCNSVGQSRLKKWKTCGWCDTPFDENSAAKAVHASFFNELLCEDCANDDAVKQYLY